MSSSDHDPNDSQDIQMVDAVFEEEPLQTVAEEQKNSTVDEADIDTDTEDENPQVEEHGSGGGSPPVTLEGFMPMELVLYPLGGRPFFPGMLTPIHVEGWPYFDTIKVALETPGKVFGIVLSHAENGKDVFEPDQLYRFGTMARILEAAVDEKENQIKLLAEGISRFEISRIVKNDPPLVAQVIHHRANGTDKSDMDGIKPYAMAVINTLKEILKYDSLYQEQVRIFLSRHNFSEPDRLADFVASMTSSSREELQEILETLPIRERLEKVLGLLKKELEMVKVQDKIQKQVESGIAEHQRQFFLREQLKEIQKELGITKDDRTADKDRFHERIEKLTLPEEAATRINEELEKLAILEPNSSEYGVTRNYVDWLTILPWGVYSKDVLDLKRAREILNRDHDGLDDVKERILEFIAVGKMKGEIGGSIILLVGPPGVGKTSIGRSVADAVGRPFYRFSVGGMRDEAEIKGHRRTYVGAMPGKFIQAIRHTKVANPIIMLDEVDKIGASYQGDPASALLEVLDPEQNVDFLDHYLDVRFDLSKVLFICTANQLDTIPRPLLDRMERIRLSGYIAEEKVRIARNHLIPKQLDKSGLTKDDLVLNTSALFAMIEGYAREAGVRRLEQKISAIARKTAVKLLDGHKRPIRVSRKQVEEFLGKPDFRDEKPIKGIGVVTGLAWTAMGGATLDVEAILITHDQPGITLTGSLGEVMKESARIAYSFVLAHCKELGGDPQRIAGNIHLHVPEGATPKDGPSAGITMTTALLSMARNKPLNRALAMTGEITLTGKVLPVGGIREKVIAARRVGIRELILPEGCRKDFEETPDYIREGFTVHFVRRYADVCRIVFSEK